MWGDSEGATKRLSKLGLLLVGCIHEVKNAERIDVPRLHDKPREMYGEKKNFPSWRRAVHPRRKLTATKLAYAAAQNRAG